MLPVRADSEQDVILWSALSRADFILLINDGTVKTEKDFAK